MLFFSDPLFLKTYRGSDVLELCGYRYSKHCTTALKTRWRCSTNCNRGCKAYVFTIGKEIVKIGKSHNHSPSKKCQILKPQNIPNIRSTIDFSQ